MLISDIVFYVVPGADTTIDQRVGRAIRNKRAVIDMAIQMLELADPADAGPVDWSVIFGAAELIETSPDCGGATRRTR